MDKPHFIVVLAIILCSSLMMLAGLYLLAKFNTLFRTKIRNELLRKNIVVWMIAIALFLSLTPTYQDFYQVLQNKKFLHYFLLQTACVTLDVLFVFNVTWLVVQYLHRRNASFRKKMGIALFTIIVSTMVMALPVNYIVSGSFLKNIEYRLLFNFYSGCMTGLVYITMSYVDVERKRKLSEKELEVTRLMALKTKAELDALHSKINPHFLYNALNSIADLAVTDGKKARKMTIALADLFRYSINYSQNNFSAVKEEVAMAEVYLQIEKIRFEDQLNYEVSVDEAAMHYLVPRFILQPIVENAVKHGLKATGKMTEIFLEIKQDENGLEINIADNGPAFPEELVPGYGVKSVFDKLDLLFPGQYDICFVKHPRKQVSIQIHKLMKNEPGI